MSSVAAGPVRWRQFWLLCASAIITIAGCTQTDLGSAVEAEFRAFLDTYVERIKERNDDFLTSVHPDLPVEMHDFFLGATVAMMRYAEEQGLSPTVECREYDVCKVTWPQPGDSWAAQSFIRHEEAWRFLPG